MAGFVLRRCRHFQLAFRDFAKTRVFATACAICILGTSAAQAQELSNPFSELDVLEKSTDLGDPALLRRLIRNAQRLTLHGSARCYARELLKLRADDELARALLHDRKFSDTASGKLVWLNWFDAGMWQTYHQVRDESLGYYLPEDREAIRKGLIRHSSGHVQPMAAWDKAHSQWASCHTVSSRFFIIKSTIPLAAIWYVADDLDCLVLAYLDYFQIEHLPARRFTVHLYKDKADADAAGADGALLETYGAYYSPPQQILHVSFDSLGGLTAVRHEAAHALNRACADPNPAQWFDEGIGVLCQFAQPQPDHTFEFGDFPKHGFGTVFLGEVRSGARERMANVHAVSHVTTNAHYYSQFRSMVDFFMNAEGKKYRMAFIKTMFRHEGDPTRLVSLPGIDAQWTRFVLSLEVDQHWRWRPFPDRRAALVQKVLEAGNSSVAITPSDSGTAGFRDKAR